MTTTIKRFRMSLVWSTYFSRLLDDAPPADAPLAALGRNASYASLFEKLLAAPTQPVKPHAKAPAVELPWPAKGTHWFWCRYLNANPIRRIKGDFAFYRLIPLRRHDSPVRGLAVIVPKDHPRATLMQQARVDQVSGEAWFHSHMVSFAVNITVSGSFTPAEMAELCLLLRHDRVHDIPGQKGALKLDELAAQALDALLKETVGEANADPVPPVTPFSAVTVLQGECDDSAEVDQGDAVHAALEAVTQWRKDKTGKLVDGHISHDAVHAAAVPVSGALLFGRERARAVWDPLRFADGGGNSLSCYHRNLLVSTLQADALLAFTQIDSELIAKKQRPAMFRACEDPVLKRIIALHGGDRTTYRSASLQRFIDAHPLRPSVNAVSQHLYHAPALP